MSKEILVAVTVPEDAKIKGVRYELPFTLSQETTERVRIIDPSAPQEAAAWTDKEKMALENAMRVVALTEEINGLRSLFSDLTGEFACMDFVEPVEGFGEHPSAVKYCIRAMAAELRALRRYEQKQLTVSAQSVPDGWTVAEVDGGYVLAEKGKHVTDWFRREAPNTFERTMCRFFDALLHQPAESNPRITRNHAGDYVAIVGNHRWLLKESSRGGEVEEETGR